MVLMSIMIYIYIWTVGISHQNGGIVIKDNESRESFAPLVWGSRRPGHLTIIKVKLSRTLAQHESHLRKWGI